MAKAEGADEDTAVQDFMQILEEHRRNCERQGKYVEAEIAKNRLEELKLHEESRRKEAMRSRQIAERLGVEEAHMLEFQQFNVVWDTKMAQFEQQSEELINSMKVGAARGRSPLLRRRTARPSRPAAQERHAEELKQFQQMLLERQQRPKFSRELLNLRRIQDALARQKECVGGAPGPAAALASPSDSPPPARAQLL